jgi:hypothetical protein
MEYSVISPAWAMATGSASTKAARIKRSREIFMIVSMS